MDNILEINKVSKAFGHVRVLNDISATLKSGVILGLAGGNGAGKSTLSNCIMGIHPVTSGTISIQGTAAMVPQEFQLIPTLKVYENLFLGREISKRGLLQKREMIRLSKAALAKLNAEIDPEAYISDLNVASKQKVELAKAILFQSQLLIMDEPTTVLNREETNVLFSILRDFRNNSGSIIYISHRLHELVELCDELAVMRDGTLVYHDTIKGLTPHDIAEKMVGHNLNHLYPERRTLPADTPIALDVANLSSGSVLHDISLTLRQGEILGLTGLDGAGRTELAEALCGIRKVSAGTITLKGKQARITSMHDALQAGLAYLSEDRQGSGLLLDESVISNIILNSLKRYAHRGAISKAECEAVAEKYVAEFQIKTDSIHVPIRSLSGGNQQKVAIAKGLDTSPEIFIFDEPTRGVDVGARAEIYRFIHKLADQGVSCILISSDLDEIIGNCARTLVMRAGRIAGKCSGDQMTEASIMYLATGVQ